MRVPIHIAVLLLLTVWVADAARAQLAERTSTTDIPVRVERKLRRDAARLTLRLQSEREDLRYQSIVIPRDAMDQIYGVLVSIYGQNAAARSVANCNVHTFPDPSIDHFVVIYDKTVAWAAPLREGISETTSPEINDLLDEFDLVIEKHVQWDDTHDALTIRSRQPLNMAALAHQFTNIEGVTETDLGQPRLRGNDIQMRRTASGWTLTYILRFGAPIGDGKQHRWIFECDDEGASKFLREEGDDVPSYLRCSVEGRAGFALRG